MRREKEVHVGRGVNRAVRRAVLQQIAPHVQISMDGRGRALDNIFTERLWRSIKYEDVYIKDYTTPRELRAGLTEYLRFYNERRLHQSLNYRPPAELYFEERQEEHQKERLGAEKQA
jgi:transposase InsO family protein